MADGEAEHEEAAPGTPESKVCHLCKGPKLRHVGFLVCHTCDQPPPPKRPRLRGH